MSAPLYLQPENPPYPHDYVRRLTPEDWQAFSTGVNRPGLCYVLSPLLVPIEVVHRSANHKITISGGSANSDQISPVLLAEHYAETSAMEDLLYLLEASPECIKHILGLPQPFWAHGTRKLKAAQDIARVVAARRAAQEALK